MPSKDMIGRVLSTGTATVSADHVRGFAAALGDANPEYATLAPPTYPIAFMTEAMSGGMNTFLELGLNFMTLVHGEQEFEFVRPVKIGETLTLTGRIADIYEKTNSAGAVLDFVVLETEGQDQGGKPVFYSRNVLISKRV
jgi:acyl dehydratase